MFELLDIITIAGIATIVGISVGVCLGYFFCSKFKISKRETTLKTQTDEQQPQPVQEDEDETGANCGSFWQEPVGNME